MDEHSKELLRRRGERPVIDDAITLAAQAVGVWLSQGIQACMNQYNG